MDRVRSDAGRDHGAVLAVAGRLARRAPRHRRADGRRRARARAPRVFLLAEDVPGRRRHRADVVERPEPREAAHRADARHLDRHHLPGPAHRLRSHLGIVVDVAESVAMTIDGALAALEGTRLAASIRVSLYFFPFLESLHVVGLTMVFGTIAVLDLRMLGVASARRTVSRIALDVETWAWIAFVVTAVTG